MILQRSLEESHPRRWENGDLAFTEHRVSVWEEEKVLEKNDGW